MGFAPIINVFDSFTDGLVAHSVMYSTGFQGIGEHNGCDVGGGRGKVNGFDAMDAKGAEGLILVLIIWSFTKVVDVTCYFIDASHHVQLVGGEVAEASRWVAIRCG